MEKKIFQKNLAQIKAVLERVLTSPYSDFYKNKYFSLDFDPLSIVTYQDFQKLPFLTREEIVETPLEKRYFLDPKTISYYSCTSGTSTKPLIVPHASLGNMDLIFNDRDILASGTDKLLLLSPPMSPPFLKFIKKEQKNVNVIPGDIHKLAVTAHIAREIAINGIFTTFTVLYYFIEELTKVGFDLKKVMWISVGGEFGTDNQMKFFREKFPNAKFELRYGNSESGGLRGYRCENLEKEVPSIYHPAKGLLLEILDAENLSGEIVHTDLSTEKGFPLIRYKTGDMGRKLAKTCPCGNNELLILSGREEIDILRFHGFLLHSTAIDTALSAVSAYIEQGQIHVYEERVGNKLEPKLILVSSLKGDAKESHFLKEIIREKFSRKLFLTANKNLDLLVKEEVILPLEIEFESSEKLLKQKRIVSHLT